MSDIVEKLRDDDYDFDIKHRELIACEIDKLHDLLGKANTLARIREGRIKEIKSDPALHFCHRFAVVLECMTLAHSDALWNEATALLSEYHEADAKWREAMGEPYVSGFGKD